MFRVPDDSAALRLAGEVAPASLFNGPKPSDSDLLSAWRAGEKWAGEMLLGRHRNSLRRFLRRRAGELAEDLLQETLLVGTRHRDTFQGQSSFRTYLFGIARNLLRRSLARQERLSTTHSIGDMDLPIPRVEPSRQDQKTLFDALLRLRQDEQLIVRQYFWDDLTAAEIAQVSGASERAIRSRLRRSLARLRKELRAW